MSTRPRDRSSRGGTEQAAERAIGMVSHQPMSRQRRLALGPLLLEMAADAARDPVDIAVVGGHRGDLDAGSPLQRLEAPRHRGWAKTRAPAASVRNAAVGGLHRTALSRADAEQ